MSRKSRRHGRYLPRSKRRKFSKGFSAPPQPSAVTPQPPVAAQRYEPEPRAEVVAPPAKAAAPRPTATLAQSPNITTELKVIGILSGIILAILIVLALVLS
jgi:hypothetical protein